MVKIQFICSEENLAYPFTENLINVPFHLLELVYVSLVSIEVLVCLLFNHAGAYWFQII